MSLPEASATHLRDGATVALDGFTHLIPFAAGYEVIQQRTRSHRHPDDARPDLRPDDRDGVRIAADLLLGREPRRRFAAPFAEMDVDRKTKS